jgi:hypothetical protein
VAKTETERRHSPRTGVTAGIDGANVSQATNPLDTCFIQHHERIDIRPHAPPEGGFHRWLSVEEIRKMQRMRRETVISAMLIGELPFDQRGRIRYARLSDVLAWEEKRLSGVAIPSKRPIAPELMDLAS